MDLDLETPNDIGLDYYKHLKHILIGEAKAWIREIVEGP
jgi:hypothetical protein